jgi:regulatory protein
VETDGGHWLLPSRVAEGMGLEEGAEIDGEGLQRTALEAQAPAAREDTGRYLARSEHTASQLAGYLRGRGYHAPVVESTVRWARRLGYVDDLRYARSYVRSHRGGRSPMGVRRLRMELRKRGVGREDAEEALAGLRDGEMEEELVSSVSKRYGHLEGEKARRRALGYLSRRGFSYGISRSVVERALGDGAGGEAEGG